MQKYYHLFLFLIIILCLSYNAIGNDSLATTKTSKPSVEFDRIFFVDPSGIGLLIITAISAPSLSREAGIELGGGFRINKILSSISWASYWTVFPTSHQYVWLPHENYYLLAVSTGLRITPFASGLAGFYIEPRIGNAISDYMINGQKKGMASYTVVNLETGFSWMFRNHLFLQICVGGGYFIPLFGSYDIPCIFTGNSTLPTRLGSIAVGYAW